MYLTIGPFRPDLVPPRDLSLRAWLPHLLEVGDGHRRHPGVLRIHDDRKAVVGHRQLDVIDAGRLARVDFARPDWPGRVGNVDFIPAEFLKPAARSRGAHGDARPRVGPLKL